ncbi:PaaI family thioesterase [Paenibacillus thalictri]|uniref:PaaI family thioesterase n=1 Tax=Paenibacillus thalictri TaxID=2527873 RepID=A0A4Q9DMH2_9BACL|nr:PaaI family thioesterase [Paenibacillus thalictri]TBL75974.1 PaaI family thioesterase [Paenibacillus thalictri]
MSDQQERHDQQGRSDRHNGQDQTNRQDSQHQQDAQQQDRDSLSGQDNEEQKKRTRSPFRDLLGIKEEHIGEGTAVLSMNVVTDLLQNQGVVHGGAIASLIDTGIGTAVYSTLRNDQHSVTIELKINYVRPGRGKQLVCKSEIVHRGGTISVGRADVFDDENRLVATGTATFYILKSLDNR